MSRRGRATEMDAWDSDRVATFKAEALEAEARAQGAIEVGALAGAEELVAEGDSWFDYLPGTDIIDCLRKYHGYRIHNFAQAGDTLENMIFGTGIDRRFQRTSPTIERVLRKVGALKPRALLFSGGGNDIAGDGFEAFLNHKDAGLPSLRRDFADDLFERVYRRYFQELIEKVRFQSSQTRIFVHGYGKTLPTGEGVGLWRWHFVGPWLRPALAMKGVLDSVEQQEIVFELIERYNHLLASLHDDHPDHFVHIDLVAELDPHTDWANELHLKNSAYRAVAEIFHEAIEGL